MTATTTEPAAGPVRPRHEGSPAALAALIVMSRFPGGIYRSELLALCGLPTPQLDDALDGLKDRHRIHCNSRGPNVMYFTAVHWRAHQEEQARAATRKRPA